MMVPVITSLMEERQLKRAKPGRAAWSMMHRHFMTSLKYQVTISFMLHNGFAHLDLDAACRL